MQIDTAIITTVTILTTAVQTIAMEYLRRRFPTPGSLPPTRQYKPEKVAHDTEPAPDSETGRRSTAKRYPR
jgi:hypothetical protein